MHRHALLLFSGVLVAAGPVPEGGDPAIDTLVDDARQSQQIMGLGLGVTYGGEVVYLGGYGLAHRAPEVPVSATETLFRWASVSKTVVGVAAVFLAQDGDLDLDADLPEIYPDYTLPDTYFDPSGALMSVPPGSTVSARQLLGHLGGAQHYSNGAVNPVPPLRSRSNPSVNTGFEWALDAWTSAPLVSLPGQAYNYSTFGFNLAGTAVGAAAADAGWGASPDAAFLAFLEARLFDPGGMSSAAADYGWEHDPDRSSHFLIVGEDRVAPDTDTDVSWKLPGGGLHSTAEDLARWCRFLSDPEEVDASTQALLWTSQRTAGGASTGYGMGFGVGSRDGRKRVSHNGSQEGASSRLVLYPADGLCVVILTNTRSATDAFPINLTSITNDVEDLLRARLAAGEPLIQAY